MYAPLSKPFERQVLQACCGTRPVIVVGNRKVVYKYGTYQVLRATTDEIITSYTDRGLAIHHAVQESYRK